MHCVAEAEIFLLFFPLAVVHAQLFHHQPLNRTDEKNLWTTVEDEINFGVNYVIFNITLLSLNISGTLHVIVFFTIAYHCAFPPQDAVQ